MFFKPSQRQLAIALTTVGISFLISACGGGNSGPQLTVSGVAATGLAIDGGEVAVQCVSGMGTATTAPNGTYSVTVADGKGPCLVTVTQGSLTLRSISRATTTGTAIANVTAFSDAIVTALVQAKGAARPAELITEGFVPSNDNLTAAVTAVIVKINAALRALGQPELATNTDLLGQADFTAATTANPGAGDALDKALDALVGANDGGQLPPVLRDQITNDVVVVVLPTATGGSGGSGS